MLIAKSDERGSLTEVIRASDIKLPIKLVYSTITYPGNIRAGHYHKDKWEWFYVASGLAKIILEDINTRETQEVILDGKVPSLLEISPFIKHTIHVVGDKGLLLIVMCNKEFDINNQDTFVE